MAQRVESVSRTVSVRADETEIWRRESDLSTYVSAVVCVNEWGG